MVKLLSLISGLLQSAKEPECAAPVPAAAWDFIVPDCDLRQGGNQSRINISTFSSPESEKLFPIITTCLPGIKIAGKICVSFK